MLRKTMITALIVIISTGTLLAKAPLDASSRRHDTGTQRIFAEQTGPTRALRFKASRPVNLRKGEIERVRPARIG